MVAEKDLHDLEARIHRMNPTAKRLYAQKCRVNLKDILGLNTFNLYHKLTINPHFLEDHYHHHHDDKVSSIAFREEQALDMKKVDEWMIYLVQEKGEDLLRYKGILHIKDMNERLVFQGIHMLFAGKADRKWKEDENKMSELVFIGKDLNKEELEKQFKGCIAR